MTVAKPSSSSSVATGSPGANPATTGIAATASSCPVRATALLTPEATPACSSSTAPSAVAVSGATVRERPSPNTTMPGNTSVQYSLAASMRVSRSIADGDDERPDGHRDPRADALGEGAGAGRKRSIASVIGTVAAPACSGV